MIQGIASIRRSRPLPDMVSFFSASRKRKQTLPELATSLLTSLPDLPFGDVKLCLDLRIDARLSRGFSQQFQKVSESGGEGGFPCCENTKEMDNHQKFEIRQKVKRNFESFYNQIRFNRVMG